MYVPGSSDASTPLPLFWLATVLVMIAVLWKPAISTTTQLVNDSSEELVIQIREEFDSKERSKTVTKTVGELTDRMKQTTTSKSPEELVSKVKEPSAKVVRDEVTKEENQKTDNKSFVEFAVVQPLGLSFKSPILASSCICVLPARRAVL